MRKITKIVVHCTATKEGVDINADTIDKWHKKRGWNGIGYHYVIKLNGDIELGRPDSKIGAHVKGYNYNSIGVVYVGGLSKDMSPKDTRTEEQKESLICLLEELKLKYPQAEIMGHRDLSKDLDGDGVISPFEWTKVCPCFDAKEEYVEL